jgi:glycerol-3-phosphate acyltransferase PlsY
MVQDILLIVVAYAAGSLSSAIIISKLLALPDPRSQGSGNPGATNMLRIGGKKAAAFTLLGDFFKGVLPVLLARALGTSFEIQLLVALAAFFGHLYPIFFGFKGGKGIATALGVFIVLSPKVALASLIIWLGVYRWKKVSSLAGLSATGSAPLIAWLLTHSAAFTLFGSVLALFIFWRHRRNLHNLLAGTEH